MAGRAASARHWFSVGGHEELKGASDECLARRDAMRAQFDAHMNEKTRTRVLVVDDEPMICDGFKLWLETAGHEVVAVTSGAQAISVAREQSFDIAVLDIGMADMDGIAVGRFLRTELDVHSLYATGSTDPEIVQRASNGALGYLVKPVDRPQLVAAVQSALSRARAARELQLSERRAAAELAQTRQIYLAAGVLMERLWLEPDEAFSSLARKAADQGTSVLGAAQAVLEEVAQKAR
jgi:two-component system, response regulator PdtaR